MINTNNIKVIHHNGFITLGYSWTRIYWHNLLNDINKNTISTIHSLAFAPENNSIYINYTTFINFTSLKAYIPEPHIKLLRVLYGLHKDIEASVKYYASKASHIKEQFMKPNDTEEYFDSIDQEDKDWLMSIVLGQK